MLSLLTDIHYTTRVHPSVLLIFAAGFLALPNQSTTVAVVTVVDHPIWPPLGFILLLIRRKDPLHFLGNMFLAISLVERSKNKTAV